MHIIRLREPWEHADGVHRRRFGKPPTDHPVRLVIEGLEPEAIMLLNGIALESGIPPFSWDVTAHLLPRNELAITTPSSQSDFNVRLEIHEPG